MTTKTIKLPCFGIVVECDKEQGSGTIVSDLYSDRTENDEPNHDLHVATNAIEAMILAHACAGVHIAGSAYIEGIETAVEKVFNEYD